MSKNTFFLYIVSDRFRSKNNMISGCTNISTWLYDVVQRLIFNLSFRFNVFSEKRLNSGFSISECCTNILPMLYQHFNNVDYSLFRIFSKKGKRVLFGCFFGCFNIVYCYIHICARNYACKQQFRPHVSYAKRVRVKDEERSCYFCLGFTV
jgi:hypothetical protein